MQRETKVQVYVTQDEYAELLELCKEEDRSVSNQVRKIIVEYCKSHKKEDSSSLTQ